MILSYELRIFVSYAQLVVFDRALEPPFNDWTDRHVAQGFSWRPGSVLFATIEEAGQHRATVTLLPQEVPRAPEAVRVIDVPFEVPPDGVIEIGSISDTALVALPLGTYQLRFEGDAHVDGAMKNVRLVLFKTANPRFERVRTDSELDPGVALLLSAAPA